MGRRDVETVIKQKTLEVCEVEYKNGVIVKMEQRVKGELSKTGEPGTGFYSNENDTTEREPFKTQGERRGIFRNKGAKR